MQYIDEFRQPEQAKAILANIASLQTACTQGGADPVKIMEFCGGHTHTLFRYGIHQLLPDWIEMVHGPGCPVCVLPRERVDDCITLAQQPQVIFTTFGDAMRVPGTRQSLVEAKASGADIRMVYSPLDALTLAQQHPEREVIFFALGFETTMPSTALTVMAAKNQGVNNFSLFCNHISTVPTLRSILHNPKLDLDGFIAPGHVSMVLGETPFAFVARDYGKPLVITGFEPLDLLQSIYMILQQRIRNKATVENQYKRVVKHQGNRQGLAAMAAVYEMRRDPNWCGQPELGDAGIQMRGCYRDYDAEVKFQLHRQALQKGCEPHCNEVLNGSQSPWQCPQFGVQCSPQTPQGALMVSSEGACAAYYQYQDVKALIRRREA